MDNSVGSVDASGWNEVEVITLSVHASRLTLARQEPALDLSRMPWNMNRGAILQDDWGGDDWTTPPPQRSRPVEPQHAATSTGRSGTDPFRSPEPRSASGRVRIDAVLTKEDATIRSTAPIEAD